MPLLYFTGLPSGGYLVAHCFHCWVIKKVNDSEFILSTTDKRSHQQFHVSEKSETHKQAGKGKAKVIPEPGAARTL